MIDMKDKKNEIKKEIILFVQSMNILSAPGNVQGSMSHFLSRGSGPLDLSQTNPLSNKPDFEVEKPITRPSPSLLIHAQTQSKATPSPIVNEGSTLSARHLRRLENACPLVEPCPGQTQVHTASKDPCPFRRQCLN